MAFSRSISSARAKHPFQWSKRWYSHRQWMGWSSLKSIDQFRRLVSANSLTVMSSFHLNQASPPLSTRCANGWNLLPVLRLRDRSVTIGTAMVFKCPSCHSYFGWLFTRLVDSHSWRWMTSWLLITWISAMPHFWARWGLWILCLMIPYLRCAARSCPQFPGGERWFNSLSGCRRPSTVSANILVQRVNLTLLDVLLHIVYRIPIVVYWTYFGGLRNEMMWLEYIRAWFDE